MVARSLAVAGSGLPRVLLGFAVLVAAWQITLCGRSGMDGFGLGRLGDASPTARLAVQAVAAALVAFLGWAGGFLNVRHIVNIIAVIWSVNLFNFIDGVDGVAASAAIVGGIALAMTAVFLPGTESARAVSMATVGPAVIVAVSALGFLPLNLPPAKLFMGDGGSTVLGLALAAVSLKGIADDVWQAAVPLAIFMPLWSDTTYTLLRRMLRGHSPLRPHREHLYQRLTLAGLGHRGVLMWILGWMLLSFAVGGLVRSLPGAVAALAVVAYAAFYVVLTEWTLRRQPNLLMNPRAIFALLYDVMAARRCMGAAVWARFNFNIDSAEFTAGDVARSLAFVVPVHALVFVGLGLYGVMALRQHGRPASYRSQGIRRGSLYWLYCSSSLARYVHLAALSAVAATSLADSPDGRRRFAYRSWKEHRLYGLAAAQGEPVLVLGAGAAGGASGQRAVAVGHLAGCRPALTMT